MLPEYLSLYVDNLLRSEVKGSAEEEVEATLDKVVMLFRFLQEKDVFEKYYKQHLAKRLLSGRVVSDDSERSMISKLKSECGYQFTSKIEGMFVDMKTSADTMHGFRAFLGSEAEGGDGTETSRVGSVELSVQVLTTGYWPTQPPSNCIFPPEIQKCAEVFGRYYQSKHSGRTLKWHANMGNADLRAAFGSRRHEINVSTYQMCILLLFNDRDTITYSELLHATHIPPNELKRALQSLACAKFKLLTKVRAKRAAQRAAMHCGPRADGRDPHLRSRAAAQGQGACRQRSRRSCAPRPAPCVLAPAAFDAAGAERARRERRRLVLVQPRLQREADPLQGARLLPASPPRHPPREPLLCCRCCSP